MCVCVCVCVCVSFILQLHILALLKYILEECAIQANEMNIS